MSDEIPPPSPPLRLSTAGVDRTVTRSFRELPRGLSVQYGYGVDGEEATPTFVAVTFGEADTAAATPTRVVQMNRSDLVLVPAADLAARGAALANCVTMAEVLELFHALIAEGVVA